MIHTRESGQVGVCKNCGTSLNDTQAFCMECGAKVERNRPVVTSRRKNRKKKSQLQMKWLVIILITALVGAYVSFLMQGDTLEEELTISGTTKESSTPNEELETGAGHDKQEGEEKPDDLISTYQERLADIKIISGEESYSLGDWQIQEAASGLVVTANKIPSEELQGIFSLYDDGDLEPLLRWAKQVYGAVEELADHQGLAFSIQAGNDCAKDYPKELPDSVVMEYSGSCGYSVPLLSGSDKESLALVVDTFVFAHQDFTADRSDEYLLADSATRVLTAGDMKGFSKENLRLARNEIFARHGYVFKSEELQAYFLQQPWYKPALAYTGELTDIEKQNVAMIKALE
ncbi:YARHG domain-containing protein [Halobacillus rhizosphaerae]|uniref:YARHG domain-containing protein n=1 Tax=Halobacillus rhizosphaerae TaxID=3064889 RepID=UPI00398AC27F